MDAVALYNAGFTSLVSVVPPGAKISPMSTIREQDAGKVPGVMGHDGYYHGYNWHQSAPRRETVLAWKAAGSNVGFLARDYPAIDIDITDPHITDAVVDTVESIMGPCVMRTGRAPKQLLVFRGDTPLRSFDVRFMKWNELLGEEERLLIQFLGDGRQYVMDGIHPATERRYVLHDPLHALTLGPLGLPTLDEDKTVEVFDAIKETMEEFGYECPYEIEARVRAHDVDQRELKAPSLKTLRELVDRIPNAMPDREDYIAMGYAIKGASQDNHEEGLEIFQDWCARWDAGHNDPDDVAADWRKMVYPFRTGFDWLVHTAQRYGSFTADLQFGPAEVPPDESLDPAKEINPEIEASRHAIEQLPSDAALLSDDWLANKYVQGHIDKVLMVEGHNRSVYSWNGTRWEALTENWLFSQIREFLRGKVHLTTELYANPKEAATAAMRLGSLRTIENVMKIVRADKRLTIRACEADADPDIIDTLSGPIHLPTGQPLDPAPERYLLHRASVTFNPMAECPMWEDFVDQASNFNKTLAVFLQALAGYAMTGHVREQIFPYFIGPGGNGKSVFINILLDILGELALTVPAELFLGKASADAMYQLANMHGARLVVSDETPHGARWNDQRIKQVTGDDMIQARQIYGAPFSFRSQATLIMVGNHNPIMEGVSEAMVRRLRLVPWDYKPAIPDKRLREKLRQELSGIFNWCLMGASIWYSMGQLPECPIITGETHDYFVEQDDIAAWADTCVRITRDDADFCTTKEIYDNYAMWARMNTGESRKFRSFASVMPQYLRPRGARRKVRDHQRGWSRMRIVPVEMGGSNVVPFTGVAPDQKRS